MPIVQFRCKDGHLTERVILSVEAAEKASGPIICTQCVVGSNNPASLATRVLYPLTAPAQFKGEGWTPKFSSAGESQIGGVPVKRGDDAQEIAKKVVAASGGGMGLTKTVKAAR